MKNEWFLPSVHKEGKSMKLNQNSKQCLVDLLFFSPIDVFIVEESKGCPKLTLF